MSVYFRYFKILAAQPPPAIKALVDERAEYELAIKAIAKEVGANESFFYDRRGEFAGFGFEVSPDKAHWRKVKGGHIFYPKKSSPVGKALLKKIDQFQVPERINSALKLVGMEPGHFGVLSVGLAFYNPSICGSSKKGWFAVVPWMDVDPDKLEEYRRERSSGKAGSGNYDHLLWTPPAEWVEVKKWEVERAIEGVEA